MKKTVLCNAAVLALLMVPAAAFAKPEVTLNVTAQRQDIVVKNGKKMLRLEPAQTFSPNQVIVYTVHYANKGDEAATNAVIEDPIPKGTAYIPESAQKDISEPLFSIDHGKTYNKPTLLSYETRLSNGKIERHVASSGQYTNIRWVLKEIPAGSGGKLRFKVRVK